MDPCFKQERLAGTCIGWVRDTIDMRYEELRDIQRASAERERAMQHSDTEPSGSLSGGGHAVSGPSALNTLGYTYLFLGMDQARTHSLFDRQGAVDKIAVLNSPHQPTSA
ncbi:uncharacterized protein FTOL_10652 [Fusarium torulosum]|uniref:Uncharacterized protein n=1 Tax=Fusarium torulosum TaxID=33205 RepID=A0AAE8MGS2_9HYPO|nr:uncharacterized protein FTOL_10652 [Fusarium torulosum]